jgi:hypothetical protein
MSDSKVGEIKEYDIYRDSLLRYLGECLILSREFWSLKIILNFK